MASSAAEFLPEKRSLRALREAAAGCRGCELYRDATQTVFGEGRRAATLMLVGEQPGDREDREGKPFVGPAGRLLDRGLEEAGIDPAIVYTTNVVKHFKWRPRGKRRLHQTPRAGEIQACKPWLESEIEVVSPRAIVALGATAAKALFGSKVRVTKDRGKLLDTPLAEIGAVTVHPSSVLRVPEDDLRKLARAELIEDLAAVGKALGCR
jgi:uracil-DNA glycosylase family protein